MGKELYHVDCEDFFHTDDVIVVRKRPDDNQDVILACPKCGVIIDDENLIEQIDRQYREV